MGILQQLGKISIDYTDLKYLYEADNVSEIRIKGRGSNDEEQVQSIIDTICKDYMDLLKSSEKLAVTIIGSSNPEAYFTKFAECLTDMDIVWQTRTIPTKKEIEISLVTIMETNQQYKLKEWSKWTLEWYLSEVKHVGQNVAYSFYNQSDLSRVKECELMIIGINPGCGKVFSEWGMKDRVLHDPDFLYKGNPCFEDKSDEVIIQELSDGWDLWKKMHRMLNYSGKGELLKHLDRFVLTNMIFFGTAKEKQIPKGIDKRECAEQTLKLINILNPNVIVLLGKECRNLFKSITNCTFRETLSPDNKVLYSYYNNSHVISIYHTAYYKYYTNENKEIIGNILGYALDNPSKRIDKKQLELYLSQKEGNNYLEVKQTTEGKSLESINTDFKDRTQLLKSMIKSNGSRQWIYKDILVHEYFTDVSEKNGKYIKSNRMIAIDLKPEGDNYNILLFTRQYDEEGARKIAEGIGEEFNSYTSNNGPRHLYKTIPIGTSNEVIATIMEELLAKVKAYRDKEYPLNR